MSPASQSTNARPPTAFHREGRHKLSTACSQRRARRTSWASTLSRAHGRRISVAYRLRTFKRVQPHGLENESFQCSPLVVGGLLMALALLFWLVPKTTETIEAALTRSAHGDRA